MKYAVRMTKIFEKEYKLMIKRNLDISELDNVIRLLSDGAMLPEKYCDHQLQGEFKGFRECHIKPNWLLIYQLNKDTLILTLSRIGTHADLFE